MEIPSVRVLVVGDSGVGKTTLLHAICKDPRVAQAHRWTTGCDVHVLYHQYREGYGAEKEVYVEFIDVGGHPKYEISRSMFYHDVQGVEQVGTAGTGAFTESIKIWREALTPQAKTTESVHSELALYQRTKGCVMPSSARPGEYPTLNALPKLVIGNKRDTIKAHAKRPSVLPELRNIESMESSAEPYALDPTVFHGFLDRVVAFANSNNTGYGDSSTDYNSSSSNGGFMSPFSEGLRQMKSKPGGIGGGSSAFGPGSGNGTSLSASPAPLSGSGGSARGWWK